MTSQLKRFMSHLKFVLILFFTLFLSSCVSLVKKSPTFDADIAQVKTIAVLPADIEVYQLSAGGVRELIDEWSDKAKADTADALKKHLAERYGFQIKFIDEQWLKDNHKEAWNDNLALYNAVAYSALLHAYPGDNTFPDKMKNFDYTLGQEIQDLAKICEADALLFVYGVDHEATAGRTALLVWNLLMGAATGITIIPTNPTSMSMGLVDGKAGDMTWFKVSAPGQEYSFRNEKHMDVLIEWFTKDFLSKK